MIITDSIDRMENLFDGIVIGKLEPTKAIAYTKGLMDRAALIKLPFKPIPLKKELFNQKYEQIRMARVGYSHMTYLDANYILSPESFVLPNSHMLNIVSFDIETYTEGHAFSDSEKDPIIAIGITDGHKYYAKYLKVLSPKNERALIEWFFDKLDEIEPSVLCHYNGNGFDIPYVEKRAGKLGLSNRFSEYFFYSKLRESYTSRKFINYDVIQSVFKDQALTGKTPDKKLETIGKYYGYDTIELPHHDMRQFINTEFLKEYHKNDVILTYKIAVPYIQLAVRVAELLSVPLDAILNSYPSFIPRLITLRYLITNARLPLYSNLQKYGIDTRFNDLFDDSLWRKYESAIVGRQKGGLFKPAYKIDFSAYYPSTMMTLNIGPDTTRIVKIEIGASDKYHLEVEKVTDDSIILKIPDRNLNKTFYIEVLRNRVSGYNELLLQLYNMRREIKAELSNKHISQSKRGILESQQNAIKIVSNSIYGFSALKTSKEGDMSVAIAIVGYCRDLTNYIMEMLQPIVIETDTDGLYISGDIDVEKINQQIDEYVRNKYKVDEVYTHLSKDAYDAMYSIKSKNYVLIDSGRIITRGSSLVSSKQPEIFNKAARAIIKNVMFSENIDLSKFVFNLNEFPISDFVLSFSLKCLPDEYKSRRSHSYKLTKAYIDKYKVDKIIPGTKIYYVAATTPVGMEYQIIDEKHRKEFNARIAYNYYAEMIIRLFKKFNIDVQDSNDLFQ